jgi:hypothetical protein
MLELQNELSKVPEVKMQEPEEAINEYDEREKLDIPESAKKLLSSTILELEKVKGSEIYLRKLKYIQDDLRTQQNFFRPLDDGDYYEVIARFVDTVLTARALLDNKNVFAEQQLLSKLKIASNSSNVKLRKEANDLLDFINLPANMVSQNYGDKPSDMKKFYFYGTDNQNFFNFFDLSNARKLQGFEIIEVYFKFNDFRKQSEKNCITFLWERFKRMSHPMNVCVSPEEVFKNWYGMYNLGIYNIHIPSEYL